MRHCAFPILMVIGLGASGISPAATPANPSVTNDQRARMLALYKEEQQARLRDSGPWALAASSLDNCAAARQMSYREETCMRAQRSVNDCNAAHADWNRRKTALLTELRKGDPNLGKEYSPNTSVIRGAPNQPNQQQMWNDTVRGLESMSISACPTTLPGTSLTPEAAIKEWVAEDAAPVAAIPRRGGSAATDRFREMNTAVEREQNTPGAREARLQAEKEEQARLAREYANRQSSDEIILSGLFAATTSLAQMQAQRNPSDRGSALLSAISGNVPGMPGGGSDAMPAISSSASGSSGGSASGGGGGVSCENAISSLIGPVTAGAPSTLNGPQDYARSGEQDVWGMQVYIQVNDSLPGCASSPTRQKLTESLRYSQKRCREMGGGNCTAGRNHYANIANLEAAIRELQQGSSSSGSPQQASSNAPANANACENEYVSKETELVAAFNRKNTKSVVLSSQALLYMLDELRGVLNSSVCAGQPGRNRLTGLEQTRLSTMQNCRSVATNPADCRPVRP